MRRRTVAPVIVVLALGFTAACAGEGVRNGEAAGTGTGPSASASAAPASSDPAVTACPDSGLLVTADRGDAAAGYRELSLHLTNCGDRSAQVEGRPAIVVLDGDHTPTGTSVVPSEHYTQAPRPLTLRPGQQARSVLSWRNTVTAGSVTPVTGVYLSIAAVSGAPDQLVLLPSPLDLGTTGRLEASVWE